MVSHYPPWPGLSSAPIQAKLVVAGLVNAVAQLVEHRVVVREVVSSTPARPTLRVLK